ncbi:hypothetical protein NI363_000792 [Salmonella enterica]|nr:hypothetical protein [Salmonella enterica]EJJ4049373.1 hypothetical protein [Salmonella enterica]EJJ4325015.1 hypothetical protein [Salmonella enterica]EJJ4329620.1 hypothetical protein [Salmonella enterica]
MQILKRRSGAIYLTEMGAFIARRITLENSLLMWISRGIMPYFPFI